MPTPQPVPPAFLATPFGPTALPSNSSAASSSSAAQHSPETSTRKSPKHPAQFTFKSSQPPVRPSSQAATDYEMLFHNVSLPVSPTNPPAASHSVATSAMSPGSSESHSAPPMATATPTAGGPSTHHASSPQLSSDKIPNITPISSSTSTDSGGKSTTAYELDQVKEVRVPDLRLR